MRKKVIPYSILAITLLLISSSSNHLYAQSTDVKFRLIEGANGMSLGKITGMTRDRDGMMWFTDQTNQCLTRYDGTQLIRFHNDPENKNSLGGNYPECLVADSLGHIWIGFYGMGLDHFDPVTKTFKHYRYNPKDPESLASDTISVLVIDHLGNLWVGTDQGLDLLDTSTGKFKHFKHDKNDSTSLSSQIVRCIYEDRQGTIWVGTGMPWALDNVGGLNQLDRKTGSFKRYMHDPKNPYTLIDNKVRSILEDSHGNFWIGTRGDGLHTMDRKTGKITRHTYNPNKKNNLSRPPIGDYGDHITFLREDPLGRIWIGTLSNGISCFNPIDSTLVHYNSKNGDISGYRDNSTWCASVSDDGLFFISTQTSLVFRIDIYPNTIDHYDIGHVNAIHEQNEDIIWFGTDNGLIKINRTTGNRQQFLPDPKRPNSQDNIISSIIHDNEGIIWAGTFGGGLCRLDPLSKLFTIYKNDTSNPKSVSSDFVRCIADIKDSILLVGTPSGLDLMNKYNGTFTHYKHEINVSSIASDWVFDILQDLEPNIYWILTGGPENYINKFNIKENKFEHFSLGIRLSTIYKDAAGIIWLGTAEGLHKYDKTQNKFIPFNNENPLLNLSRIISITEDHEQNLWLSSRLTLYRLNKSRDKIMVFGPNNNLTHGELEFHAITTSKTGSVVIGTSSGYYEFFANKIIPSPLTLKIGFSTIEVNGVNNLSVKNLDKIELNHNQNFISIGLSIEDYNSNFPGARVYYKLENYDNTWKSLTTNQIQYFNIEPGDYKLQILASDPTNGNTQERSLSISIAPPWWQTIWAYSMFGFAFIGGVYGVHRFQKARVIRAERERSREKELIQAKEIEKAYNELKFTQTQLIQSEKMASLGELTAGIAHEIQNPLNFVNNFSEINQELILEMKGEVDKGNINEAKSIANDILENERKIISHGKRADGIVKSMLQHSRGSTGQKELVNVNELCDEYLRLSYHGLRAKDKSFNAKFETTFDPAIEKILVVPQDIGRVILNLINNAFYAVSEKQKSGSSPDYEPIVSVITKKTKTEIQIHIKDNGNGISREVSDKIFQPFFTTKPTGKGTGLGLSLSYEIIKNHGGNLKVETQEGEFAEFIIVLPNGTNL